MQRKPKTPPTVDEAFTRLAGLCAVSEQCESDLRDKLFRRGLDRDDIGRVIDRLVDERFLDNARYAKAFASDKVRFAGWGRYKIRAALAAKRIAASDIAVALAEIDEETYRQRLERVVEAKYRSLKGPEPLERDDINRLLRHVVSRGFETNLATEAVKKILRCNASD